MTKHPTTEMTPADHGARAAQNDAAAAPITLGAVTLKAIDLAPDDDAPLDFYAAAIALGASKAEADQLDTQATLRMMTGRGQI